MGVWNEGEFGFDFSFGAHDLCIVFKIHMMTIRFMNMAADLFDDDLNWLPTGYLRH